MQEEINKIKQRYAKRSLQARHFSFPSDYNLMYQRDFELNLHHMLKRIASLLGPIHTLKLLEIGCGNGGKLLQMLKFGFNPENMIGNELLVDRATIARKILSAAMKIIEGDARTIDYPNESFDIILQSTVFTSILDEGFQRELADKMWSLLKSGGFILWFDFIYNNPKNPDVRGVSIKDVKKLFPKGNFQYKRLLLAPPISRLITKPNVTQLSVAAYNFLNLFPFLRTHVLGTIQKV